MFLSRISAQGGSYQRTIGNSNYSGLQTKIEQQLANGLSYLVTYTWSKTMSNSGDLLNGSPNEGLRAPYVPGAGPKFDWGPADFDIRNVFHLSGTYELPFGKNKKYMANAGKLGNQRLRRLERQCARGYPGWSAHLPQLSKRNNLWDRLQ